MVKFNKSRMKWKWIDVSKLLCTQSFQVSKRQAQFKQTGDKKDRQNAFGCTLPFRVIRYARNRTDAARRAVTRIRRRARAYTWAHRMHFPRCTSRVTIIGTQRHTYTPLRMLLWNSDWKFHNFDFRCVINTILKIFLLPIVAFPPSRIITEIIFVWLHYRNPISVNYAGFNLWNEICNAHHAMCIERALRRTSNI